MGMDYVIRQIGDVTVLDLSGRISLESFAFGPGSAAALHQIVRDQAANGHLKILLTLGHITYIDSFGLGELVACKTTLHGQGGQLRTCNAAARVRDSLRVTNLDTVLNLDSDETTSLQAFGKEQQKGTSAA